MRRILLAILLCLGLLATAGAAEARTASLTVTPTNGNQFRSFTVAGSGFRPGTLVGVFIAPDGEEFTVWHDGNPSITVSASGSFRLTVVPAVDFAGARSGRWQVRLCTEDGFDCWTAEFSVSL